MFQRKGTVSKSSGPVHVNSYALRGVPIRYTPPFFLPDQLTLPVSWTLPSLPSDDLFRYDYSRERQVLEQARVRTVSLAAEAEAREKSEEAEEEKRRMKAAAAAERAKVTTSTADLLPPLFPSPGSAILTPTQAPPTLTMAPPTITGTESPSVVPSKSDARSGIHIKDSTDVLKPLGEMSFSEFEGDNFNPFDATSLQAINDMEILQTISLAPPPPIESPPKPSGAALGEYSGSKLGAPPGQDPLPGTSPVPAPVTRSIARATSAPVGGSLQIAGQPLPPIGGAPSQPLFPPSTSGVLVAGQISSGPSSASGPLSVAPLPHPSLPSLPTLPVLPPIGTNLTHSHSDPTNTSTPSQPPSATQPTPPLYPTPPRPQGTPPLPPKPTSDRSLPISISSSPPISSALPQPSLYPCPSLIRPPASTQFTPPLPGTSPTAASYPPVQPASSSSPGSMSESQANTSGGIGTLVNLRAEAGTTASPAQLPAPQKPPVPKPRTNIAGKQVPNSAHLPYQGGPAPQPSPPAMTGAAAKPPPARSTVQARANSLAASLPQGQPLLSRPGLGVQVLPPIPHHSSSSPSLHPPQPPPRPPPYQQQATGTDRSNSPPPPYYPSSHGSEETEAAARRFSQPVPLPSQQHTPSHFTLPDPQLSLSPEERAEVGSMAGMGFPGPRVARAIRRFSGDRTQVVDFLILVGGLEESSGSKGDSAEVALTVCDNNQDKAKRYLQKVSYYRESGFSEQSIHEAFEKAGRDWDRALDLLTQNTAS